MKKKVGPGWFKLMIYLPLPFCRKKRSLARKRAVYDLPFLAKKLTKVDHKLAPLDGLKFKHMIYLALF